MKTAQQPGAAHVLDWLRHFLFTRVRGANQMKNIFLIALALSLSACATCQRYPVACAVGSAVIAGSVATTIAANDGRHSRAPMRHVSPPDCAVNPALCQ